MNFNHTGPAKLTLDNGDQYDVKAQLIANEREGSGLIWGPPAFVAFRHGSQASLAMAGVSIPIIITAADLTGPSKFIVSGAPKIIAP